MAVVDVDAVARDNTRVRAHTSQRSDSDSTSLSLSLAATDSYDLLAECKCNTLVRTMRSSKLLPMTSLDI